MGASIFIIDPAYTMPLLVACGAAWWLRERRAASWWLLAAVLLSTAYLGWSLMAKAIVERAAQRTLAAEGLQDAPRFSVPIPFNTLLWRVVVMTPHPGTVKVEVPIALQRPRDPLSVEFLDYQKQLLRHLGQETHA